ncbi:MAG TPA: tetratricopeptide repeat protein [Terriglobales bacterium]|jgi:tetratricopeptide (TPR) repeat protein
MQRITSVRFFLASSVLLSTAMWSACNQSNSDAAQVSAAANREIPITTKSDDAKREYLAGRDLSERLLAQESFAHFQKAAELDPDFATDELALATNAPTTKEFFEHLNKAITLADKATEGEKWQILAAQAGANGDTTKQKEYLDKLVAAYPNDERAQANIGNYYFGQQDLTQTIEHYKKATEIAPNYSPSYNILGYAYKQQGDYSDAEQAFKKYVELIPNDPNPYDSYGELLLKMGRYDESMVQYKKALSINSHFPSSHFGIAGDLMYEGKYADAQAEMQKIVDEALNPGEKRLAYFGMSVVASDNGKFDKAEQAMDKEYAIAQQTNDFISMAADLQAKGNIFAAMPNYAAAKQQFDRSFLMIQSSSASNEIKENSRLLHEFNLAAIAMEQKDFAAAKTHIDEYRKGAEAKKNSVQITLGHELAGRLALGQKDYDTALTELAQANQQDPRNLLRVSQAYAGKGDSTKAQQWLQQAADFNPLPALNYAFIHMKAKKMLAMEKKA